MVIARFIRDQSSAAMKEDIQEVQKCELCVS